MSQVQAACGAVAGKYYLAHIFVFFEFDCEDSYKKPKKLFQCKFYFNSVSKVIAFLSLRQFIMVLMRRIFAALFPYLRKKVYFCILKYKRALFGACVRL